MSRNKSPFILVLAAEKSVSCLVEERRYQKTLKEVIEKSYGSVREDVLDKYRAFFEQIREMVFKVLVDKAIGKVVYEFPVFLGFCNQPTGEILLLDPMFFYNHFKGIPEQLDERVIL